MDYSIPPTLGNINAALVGQNVTVGTLAIGGATIGGNALAVTGTALFTGNVDSTGYTNTSTAFQAAAAGSFYWNARSLMASPSDGVIKLSNNGQTDFTSLQFGGTTSSFPSIRRSGTNLLFRLADDSNEAGLFAGTATLNNVSIGATGWLGWSSTAFMRATAAGRIKLGNAAETDFDKLQFGGTTSSFPAIKRNGAALDIRLADDSGYASLTAASLTLGNALTMNSALSFYPQATLSNQVADANGPYLVFRKGRATGTTTQNGDTLGNILFSGYASDNSIFNGPYISVIATGAASATGIATSTIFNTSTNTGATEAFRYDTNGSVSVIGSVTSRYTTAIPAGGTAGLGLMLSSTANFGVFFGSGAPTLSAAKGSLYLRSDGSGVADRMYVNTNGSTTWTAVTTVA